MAFSLRNGLFALIGGLALLAGTANAQYSSPVNMDAPDPWLEPPPPAPRFKAYFQRRNCCCASHHDDLGCTSGDADCKFIFGSCRTFWSEPCPQGPSPYNYVPPQSTKPPPKPHWWRFGRCDTCQ